MSTQAEKQIIRYISMALDNSLQIMGQTVGSANIAVNMLEKGFALKRLTKDLDGDFIAISGLQLKDNQGNSINITKNVMAGLKVKGIPYAHTNAVNGEPILLISEKDRPELQAILDGIRGPGKIDNTLGGSYMDHPLEEYNKFMGNSNLKGVVGVSPEIQDEMAEALKEKGIDFNTLFYEGVAIINFDESYQKEVQQIHDKIVAEHMRGGIVDRRYLMAEATNNQTNEPEILEIKGLSANEAHLFVENAKELGIHIGIKHPRQDSHTIVFCKKDLEAINVARAAVAISLVGEAGKAYNKSLQYQRENLDDIIQKSVMQDMKENLYIVDGINPDITVTPTAIKTANETIRKDDVSILASERTENAQNELTRLMKDMKEPVQMTEEQYKEYCNLPKKDKSEFLWNIDHQNGRPKLTKEEYHALKHLEEKHSLYEQKISESAVPQEYTTYSYTNDEMRMGDFREYEKANWELEHDKSELLTVGTMEDATVYNDALAAFKGMAPEIPKNEISLESMELSEAILSNEDISRFGFNEYDNVLAEMDKSDEYYNNIADDIASDETYLGNPYLDDSIEFPDEL